MITSEFSVNRVEVLCDGIMAYKNRCIILAFLKNETRITTSTGFCAIMTQPLDPASRDAISLIFPRN
jgi:hypothetical protein